MKERINNVIDEQIENLENLKDSDYSEKIILISEIIIDALRNGNKVLIAGNGGSAADSQHIAAEFVGRFALERKGLPAIALTTDSSNLTSISNDYSFDDVFSRQIEALGNKNDVFVGISTSGNSKNIINAVNMSKQQGLKTICLLGKDGGKLKNLCDYNITFNYSETARVQEHHILTYHLICEFVEKAMKEYYEK